MSEGVAPIGGAPPPPPQGAEPPAGTAEPLPPPTATAMDPSDALGMMMAAMERMSQTSIAGTERNLRVNQDRLKERLEKFMDQVAKALRAAKKAAEKKDDGGFLSDFVDTVADVVGDLVGTVVDFAKDCATMPYDIAVEGIQNPQAMMSILKGELTDLATNGETAESVKGFTKGVIKFEAALVETVAKLHAALAESALTGEPLPKILERDAKQLWQSFRENVLENPEFWEVAGPLAKAAAVAAAVMSGGALAPLAVGLLVLVEADARYGFVDDVVGEDAAPWVRLGMQAAATAMLGAAAGGGDGAAALRWFQAGTAALQGAAQIDSGIEAMHEGDRRADEIEREADLQETLDRMHQLQRLTDDLIALLEEQEEGRSDSNAIGKDLFRTKAATDAAIIMRA